MVSPELLKGQTLIEVECPATTPPGGPNFHQEGPIPEVVIECHEISVGDCTTEITDYSGSCRVFACTPANVMCVQTTHFPPPPPNLSTWTSASAPVYLPEPSGLIFVVLFLLLIKKVKRRNPCDIMITNRNWLF